MNRVDLRQFLGCGFVDFSVCDFNTASARYHHLFFLLLQYARRLIYTIATTENGKSDIILAIMVIVIGNESVAFSIFVGNC